MWSLRLRADSDTGGFTVSKAPCGNSALANSPDPLVTQANRVPTKGEGLRPAKCKCGHTLELPRYSRDLPSRTNRLQVRYDVVGAATRGRIASSLKITWLFLLLRDHPGVEGHSALHSFKQAGVLIPGVESIEPRVQTSNSPVTDRLNLTRFRFVQAAIAGSESTFR